MRNKILTIAILMIALCTLAAQAKPTDFYREHAATKNHWIQYGPTEVVVSEHRNFLAPSWSLSARPMQGPNIYEWEYHDWTSHDFQTRPVVRSKLAAFTPYVFTGNAHSTVTVE